ncbi:MAG: DUF4386 domain-containing protein [Acidimicrobiales bacterium]
MTITIDHRTTSAVPTTPVHAVGAGSAGELDATVTDRRRAAIVAGVGYVALFVLGIFANFVVREGLVVADDPTATATNITESLGLFRIGLFSFLAVFLIDVVVAWALYVLFRSQHRDLSLVSAWFRIVYTVFMGVAAVFFFQALNLYESPYLAEAMSEAQRNAQALAGLELFNSAWLIGLAAFGVHLVVMGALVTRSTEAPRVLGYLMMLAGLAYVIDTSANTLLADYDTYAGAFLAMVAIPSVIAEGWFGLWLLTKAGKPAVR